MKTTRLSEEVELLEFAKAAATHFAAESKHWSYGDLIPGSYLALRWGLGDDCVLVLKLDEDFAPVNYMQLVEQAPTFGENAK